MAPVDEGGGENKDQEGIGHFTPERQKRAETHSIIPSVIARDCISLEPSDTSAAFVETL